MFTKLNILIIVRTITILQFIRGVSRLNQRISGRFSNLVINTNAIRLSSSLNSLSHLVFILSFRKSTLRIQIRQCLTFNKQIGLLLLVKVFVQNLLSLRIKQNL